MPTDPTALTPAELLIACRVTLLVPEPGSEFSDEDTAAWRAEELPYIEREAAKRGYVAVEVMHPSEFSQHVNATHGGQWFSESSHPEPSWTYFQTWEASQLSDDLYG